MRCCYWAELLQLIFLRTNYAALKESIWYSIPTILWSVLSDDNKSFLRNITLPSCYLNQGHGLNKHAHSNSHVLRSASSGYDSAKIDVVTDVNFVQHILCGHGIPFSRKLPDVLSSVWYQSHSQQHKTRTICF